MDGRLIQVDLVSLPVAISRLGTSLNHWASIPEFFYSVYCFAVMRLHSHGFERRSLRPEHHTAYQKHCLVKRVLLSKASYGQIYSTVKSNTCSNASNCQKHRMVKRATLSKAAYGQL